METRHKIILVVTKSNWGGAQKYVYDIATSLPTEFEVIVAFGGTGLASSEEGELAYRLREANIATRFIHAFARDVRPLDEIRACVELISLFRKERPTIVHLNSSKAGVLGALAARVAGVPKIVFTAHGWPFLEQSGILGHALRWFGSWVTVLLSDVVICISDFDRAQAARLPYAARKLERIYNGIREVDLLERAAARSAIVSPEIAARHAQDVWVVSNAELTANKDLHTGIDAATRYHDAHPHGASVFYVIIGDGEERASLEKDIARRRMNERVFLAGFIPGAARYLQGFDVFLLPSRKEGLPYVLLEAGAASLAVIASKVGGIPEIVSEGKTGLLVDPKDAERFAEAINTLGNNAALREEMGASLQRDVRARFSFERMVRETTEVYRAPSPRVRR